MLEKVWTEEEDKTLFDMFSSERIWSVLEKLPNKTPYQIMQRAEKLNIPRNKYKRNRYKYKINENFFETWTPESAWVYGFIVADGHITTGRTDRDERQLQIELAEYDEDILIQIKKLIEYEGPVRKSKRGTVNLDLSNKKIIDDLIYLGIPLFNKTEKQEWPESLPGNLVNHFVRGVFDGDGSVYEDVGIRVQFLGTENILKTILDYAPIEHSHKYIHNRKKYGGANVYHFKLSRRKALPFLEWMYEDAKNFSTRKVNRCYEILKKAKDKNLKVNGYDAGTFLKLRELLGNMTPSI